MFLNRDKIRYLLLFFISYIFVSFTNVEEYHLPAKSLFRIERSKDSDQIVYEPNITAQGKLNINNPVKVYWLKPSDANKTEPISWIQKNFSYGLTFLNIMETEAKFQFVSYNKRTFKLRKNDNGDYQVFTNSLNKRVALNRIFIQIDGGTFWFPNITKIDIYSTDIKTGKTIIETINP